MEKRLVKDLLAYLPSKVLPALTSIITVPIFTRLFAPDVYGNYVLAYGVVQLMIAGIYSGHGAATVRFYSVYKVNNRLPDYFFNLFFSIAIAVAIGVVGGALLLLVIGPAIPSSLRNLLWLALPLFAAMALYHTLTLIVRAQERSGIYTVFELLNRYGSVLISLALIYLLDVGVSSLLWGELLIMIGLLGFLIPVIRRGEQLCPNGANYKTIRVFWRYAWPLTLGNLAMWGVRLSDRYFIEGFRDTTEVGLYSVSFNISSRTIDMLVSLFMLVPAPILMRVWEEEGPDACARYLFTSTRLFFLIITPSVVGIGIIAKPLVQLLADNAYLDGYHAVWPIAVASMALGLSQLGSFGLLLTHQTLLLAMNQCVALGIGLGVNFILVPWLGYMGAAVTALLSTVLLTIFQIRSSTSALRWIWPVQTMKHVAIACLVMGLGAGLFHLLVSEPQTTLGLVSVLGGTAGIGSALYIITLWFLGEFSLAQIRELSRAVPEAPEEMSLP